MKHLLKGILDYAGLEYKETIDIMFSSYADMLIEWNKKFNLTGITDLNDIYIKHFADSLILYKGIKSASSLIDIGSGAGFPGIPLKIAGYDKKVVLLEANGKKTMFLDHVINSLKLKDISTCLSRAEVAGRDSSLRDSFEIATARAVAPLNVLLEYCTPFIKKGGVFIAMKTDESELNIAKNAQKQLGVEVCDIDMQILPFSDMKRCNIYFKKIKNTPDRYPRADGIPKKKPL
ncbi:MAG TPA: 16S rRNA (guanine(527)-N(7))-methyltransferase RsmG [Clostridia bacterium]|nr:16S rRNA (guanine(527)-N(7))-methyltransferase RsmG [Clostridia bacterium]